MILITLSCGYMVSLRLVVIRQIRIGPGSDIHNKDQTYPVRCVDKVSRRYVYSCQPRILPIHESHTCAFEHSSNPSFSSLSGCTVRFATGFDTCRSTLRSRLLGSSNQAGESNSKLTINDPAMAVSILSCSRYTTIRLQESRIVDARLYDRCNESVLVQAHC